jgi:hypothetical protein
MSSKSNPRTKDKRRSKARSKARSKSKLKSYHQKPKNEKEPKIRCTFLIRPNPHQREQKLKPRNMLDKLS